MPPGQPADLPFGSETLLLSAAEPGSLERAAAALRQGQIVAFPTDTVYGVGVVASNAAGISRLYEVKGRALDKGIPVLLADLDDLPKIAASIPEAAQSLMARFWPGPLTLVVPRRPDLPANISPDANIAVRIPDHPVARALIRAAGGALATSSANLSGQPAATTAREAYDYLRGRVAIVLDDGPSPGGSASTVVDCTASVLRILRTGPISASDLGLEADS